MALDTAGRLKEITDSLTIPFIYKSSYDKANRSSGESFRGPGMQEGLRILEKVRSQRACASRLTPRSIRSLLPWVSMGGRREKLPVSVADGQLRIQIDTATLADGPTPFFELVKTE